MITDLLHQIVLPCCSSAVKDELEAKLKAEIILTRLLREKLHSNELEFEQLEADLASSVRVHDVMQTEIQRMQDEVSCLTHKTMDKELKVSFHLQARPRVGISL